MGWPRRARAAEPAAAAAPAAPPAEKTAALSGPAAPPPPPPRPPGRAAAFFRRMGLGRGPPRPPPSRPAGRWVPEEAANPLSRLFFVFCNSLVSMGARKHLEQADLWDTASWDEPAPVYGRFDEAMRATAHPGAPQGVLWRAMWRVHGGTFWWTGALKLLHDGIMFLSPYILERLLSAIGNGVGESKEKRLMVLGLAAALLGAALMEALTINIYFNALFRTSLHAKTQLLELLYAKSLRLAGAARAAMGVGPIVNLQSNDAAKLWALPTYGHMLWNAPVQIIVVMGMLVRILTVWPALAGLAVTVAIIPTTWALGKALAKVRAVGMKAADARVKLVSEVITGIKAIKLYAWEEPYSERISALREEELKAIRKMQLIGMISSSVFNTGPVLVALAAFGVYAALGNALTASVAFPALALFNLLRFPVVMLPLQITNCIAAAVGVRRIQAFLNSDETPGVMQLEDKTAAGQTLTGNGSGAAANGSAANGKQQHMTVAAAEADAPVAIKIDNGSFAWAPGQAPVLRDVSLELPRGALTVVVGPVGAGKSSLLAAILGEMVAVDGSSSSSRESSGGGNGGDATSKEADSVGVTIDGVAAADEEEGKGKRKKGRAARGKGKKEKGAEAAANAVQQAAPPPVPPPVAVAGSVAYTAQDPWIRNATLRDNVLMGIPMDEVRYADTIDACCLEKDLEMLPAGDASEIGEKGINLSGGQKHRVALARATYAGADVYLLDDPLSAVDAHVGRHLFDRAVCGALAGATRVLVTHQLQFLPRADLIVVILDGRIAHIGTHAELTAKGVDFAALVPAKQVEEEGEGEGAGMDKPAAVQQQLKVVVAAAEPPLQQQQQQQQEKQKGNKRGGRHKAAHPPPAALPAVAEGTTAAAAASGGGGPPAQSAPSIAPGMMPPAFFTRSLAVGGSFASHKPLRLGDRIGPGGILDDGDDPSYPFTAAGAAAGGVNATSPPAAAAAAATGDVATAAVADGGETFADGQTLTAGDVEAGLVAAAVTAGSRKGADDAAWWAASDTGDDGSDSSGIPAAKAGGVSKGMIIKEEGRARGRVKRSVYLAYLKAWGPLFIIPIAIAVGALGERGMQVAQNWVLSLWSNATAAFQSTPGNSTATPLPFDRTRFYLILYFGLGLGSVVVVLLRSALQVSGSIAASRQIHAALLAKVLRLPMSFFDSQPTGRLVNRFTKDCEALDTQMSMSVASALTMVAGVVLSIASVAAVSPWVLLALVPLSVLYYRVQRLYIATSRELKRLDSVAFSPIFQHFGESLAGLATIRAFGRQNWFTDVNTRFIRQSNRAWWPIQLLNRWLSMRLEVTGALVVFLTAVAVGVVAPRDAGLAGFALTAALNLTGTLAWMVRQTTELEVNMNAVERMIEYQDEPEEAPAIVAPRPPPSWPAAGAISVRSLTVRYRPELDPVLKGVSFEVAPREKIGVVGRTGCGKSTLMMTLFRMVEPCGGAVLIDGLDTASLGLSDLRSRLSLVPQDPVIFSGTVRSNLDPFNMAPGDAAIWEALRRAGVDSAVRALGAGLDSPIQEGGGNLSAGQRQLLCMARALLRSSRILVLDEATSNVDHATDGLIQSTIRTAFADCTVLTIAHRLHTIADADRVLVLDSGRVAEYGPPSELMEREGGVFRGLVEEAGRHHGAPSDQE